jgi:hypothetical protein
MRVKYIDKVSAVVSGSANKTTKEIPAGNFRGLLLTLVGTTDTGETLTLDDIGTVRVNKAGFGELVNMDIGFGNSYAQLIAGYPATVSGSAATAERVVSWVPFDLPLYPNVQQILRDGDLTVSLEFGSNMPTRFGSNAVTMEVKAILAEDIFQTYDLVVASQNQQASGSGRIANILAGGNIANLFLRDSGSVVDSLTVLSDRETVVDSIDFETLKDITNLEAQVESAGNPWAEIALASTGVKESTYNNENQVITTFSGSGTMDLYKFQVNWLSVDEQSANAGDVQTKLDQKGR